MKGQQTHVRLFDRPARDRVVTSEGLEPNRPRIQEVASTSADTPHRPERTRAQGRPQRRDQTATALRDTRVVEVAIGVLDLTMRMALCDGELVDVEFDDVDWPSQSRPIPSYA